MHLPLPTWHRSNGEIVSCIEKIMRENIEELQQVIQDAYEDALLMDVDSEQIKQFLIKMIQNLESPYQDDTV